MEVGWPQGEHQERQTPPLGTQRAGDPWHSLSKCLHLGMYICLLLSQCLRPPPLLLPWLVSSASFTYSMSIRKEGKKRKTPTRWHHPQYHSCRFCSSLLSPHSLWDFIQSQNTQCQLLNCSLQSRPVGCMQHQRQWSVKSISSYCVLHRTRLVWFSLFYPRQGPGFGVRFVSCLTSLITLSNLRHCSHFSI